MHKLLKVLNKSERVVIGLMSGTSLDGIDVAILRITGNGDQTSFRLLDFHTAQFDSQVREEILQIATNQADTESICKMNFLLGDLFAESIMQLCERNCLNLNDVDIIGSHGQTVCHLPGNSTLQIGEPAVIAEKTGVLTVADFRVSDVAAGGQGAPLVAYVDYLLNKQSGKNRALQNIGGIGNVTYIPCNAGINDVIAFDTGPGNIMINTCISIMSDGRKTFDDGGKLAACGNIQQAMLDQLLSHPYFRQPLPKTTGREVFGEQYTKYLIDKYLGENIDFIDILTTLTAFTAASIRKSYELVLENRPIDEIIISGGGSHNKTLLKMLQTEFAGSNVLTQENLGCSSDAKEAIAFGILANEAVSGNANNLPGVTGARHPVVMGKIIL